MAYNDYKVTRSDGVAVGDLSIGLDTYHSTFYAAYIEGLKAPCSHLCVYLVRLR